VAVLIAGRGQQRREVVVAAGRPLFALSKLDIRSPRTSRHKRHHGRYYKYRRRCSDEGQSAFSPKVAPTSPWTATDAVTCAAPEETSPPRRGWHGQHGFCHDTPLLVMVAGSGHDANGNRTLDTKDTNQLQVITFISLFVNITFFE